MWNATGSYPVVSLMWSVNRNTSGALNSSADPKGVFGEA
jgi:hypothetical protein